MISVHLTASDLVEMRFVYSPLFEAAASYEVLITPEKHAPYQAWVNEALKTLEGVELPYIGAAIYRKRVVGVHHYMADFLTPPPLVAQRNFEDELVRLRHVSEDMIRDNIQKVVDQDGLTDARLHFLTYPRDALECLIEELRFYWQRTLAHHWARLTSVLENDVLYRARQLALHGTDALFADLHPLLRYAECHIQIEKPYDDERYLNGQGILLAPVIFVPKVSWQITPEWQPMIMYSARGTGLWRQDENPEDIEERLQMILGEGKAKILQALTNPLNTGELAHKLQVTPGAISQHLNKLTQAGLVESHRSGNFVFYRLSNRGERLLNVFLE